MIRINLLPETDRQKARTPVKLFIALAGAVLLNAGLATWWAFSAFGEQAEIESQKTALQLEMDGLTPQVNYFKALEGEKKQYQSREETLASITKNRISWTRKLDELIDVVNRGGDGQRHLVWLDDLNASQNSDPKAKDAGSLRANAHSGSEKYAQIANFLEDLESSPFISDFRSPAPPEGSQAMVDETLVPSTAWSFPLAVSLKSPEERLGKAPADPKAKGGKAPAKGAGAKSGAGGAQAPDAGASDAPQTSGAEGARKEGGQ